MLSLKQRIFGIAAIALIPALGILAFNEVQLRRERTDEIRQTALRQAHLASLEVERILEGVRNVLAVASVAPEVEQPGMPACQPFLAGVVAQVAALNAIAVFSPEGARLCGSVAGAPPIDLSKSELLAAARLKDGMQVGEYTISPSTGRRILPVAMGFGAQVRAGRMVLAGGISLDWLGQRLKERGLTNGGQLTLADRNGVILTRDPLPEKFVGTRIPERFLPLVTAAAPGVIEVKSQDGTERILGYVPVTASPQGIYVSAGISKAEAYAPIDRASAVGAALIVVGGVVAFALAWLAGRAAIQRPVNRILEVAEGWKRGDLSGRTGFRAEVNELQALGAALDAMADELKARSEHATLLSREMAHRVKNLLAVVQAMASQTFRDGADRSTRKIFDDRLRALAATYELLMRQEWTGGDLAETIRLALGPHLDPQRPRVRLAGETLEVDAPLALAITMIVHELATNAIKYGALSSEEGMVEVTWSRSANWTSLTWQESGGPTVQPPKATGFGSRLIQNAIPAAYKPSVLVEPLSAGLRCSIRFHHAASGGKEQPKTPESLRCRSP